MLASYPPCACGHKYISHTYCTAGRDRQPVRHACLAYGCECPSYHGEDAA